MLQVFITIDTEIWPRDPVRIDTGIRDEMKRDIYGETGKGEYGIRYQIDRFNAYGLKAVYLVESLFASAVGLEPLQDIVQTIRAGGHEVQLHLHTEWLKWMKGTLLPGRAGQHIKNFTFEEQVILLGEGIRNLRECGVANVTAYRAGNFGANFETLRALNRVGLLYDTSHNTCFLDSICELREGGFLLQPKKIHGVYEFPVSFFMDRPGHYRPAQINACSSSEMRNALMQAWKRDWSSFVIVTHSFELLNARRNGPDYCVIRRFEDLCRFLAENPDKFRTSTFADAASVADAPHSVDSRPLQSNVFRTAWRMGEQAISRLLY